MEYLVSAVTDIGNCKQKNEDAVLVKKAVWKKESVLLAVLCDGMGGLEKGEVASTSMIRAFSRWFELQLPQLLKGGFLEEHLQDSWGQMIDTMNRKLCVYGKCHGLQMGTTVTAMLFCLGKYYVVHVGDCRIYKLNHHIFQITKDQTLVQKEVDLGMLTCNEARTDPRRSILLQCVGATGAVTPVYESGSISKNSVYLLCCDGFRHQVTEQEIFRFFCPKKMFCEENMLKQSQKLIALNKKRGERDNISVIAIRT